MHRVVSISNGTLLKHKYFKMKKTILSIAIISMTVLSCEKEDANKLVSTLGGEISQEPVQITLVNSGGEINTPETLVLSDDGDYYNEGSIDYIQNGQKVAQVNFGNGENNSLAALKINGEESEIELKKDESYYNGKKSKYKKVIVEPLVKSEECEYIIAGIIKYYDYKSGDWVATIDFGELECDEWAVKTTADSQDPYTFSLKDLDWK